MKTISFLLSIFLSITICKADRWIRKADFPDGYRDVDGHSFVIGGRAYILAERVWEYDPVTDTWGKKSNLPFRDYFWSVDFSIGDYGYAYIDSANEFWQYAPLTDTWSRKADLPGTQRSYPTAFVIGSKAYLGGGSGDNNFYCYDPSVDSWTPIADFPYLFGEAIGFAVKNKGYITGILDANTSTTSIKPYVFEYDPFLDSWTKKGDFPGIPRCQSLVATIGNMAYLGMGVTANGVLKDWWLYDPMNDLWKKKTDIPSANGKDDMAVSMNNRIFIGFGADDNCAEVWEYTPDNVRMGLCQGTYITLVTGTSGGIWRSGDTAIATVDTETGYAKGIEPGTALITNENNTYIETFQLDVYALPSVSVVVTPVSCNVNDGSLRISQATGIAPFQFVWNNGETGVYASGLPQGVYTLTVTDVNKCMQRSSFTIEDTCSHYTYIEITVHNGVSPNGDGINDSWIIDGIQTYPANTVEIFDKWGDVVFKKQSYNNDWQGQRASGDLLPDGTYYYVVKLNALNVTGGKNVFTGSLMVKR